MRLTGVWDDDLERSGRRAKPLDDDSGRASLQGKVHELVAVVAIAPQGDKDLTGVEFAAIGRAARDDQVSTANEPGLGQ
jgi:hypothetical protein